MVEEAAVVEEVIPQPVCGCGVGLRKAGKTPNGSQRWECRKCNRSLVGSRPDVAEVLAGRKPVEEARNPVLTAYRHVLENKEAKYDRSGLERTARTIHEDNPQRFMDRYDELEAEERGAERVSRAGDAVAVGVVGSDERGVRELIRGLLSEMKGVSDV
jgi:hypothetical protein